MGKKLEGKYKLKIISKRKQSSEGNDTHRYIAEIIELEKNYKYDSAVSVGKFVNVKFSSRFEGSYRKPEYFYDEKKLVGWFDGKKNDIQTIEGNIAKGRENQEFPLPTPFSWNTGQETLDQINLTNFDLDGIMKTAKKATTRKALVDARVGQGEFRKKVKSLWGGKCLITGVDKEDLLIASHIKGWGDCKTNDERLDGYNGLLLAPHIDKLFDKHLMTFSNDGYIIAKPEIMEILKRWGIDTKKCYGEFHPKTKKYMDHHREYHNKKNNDFIARGARCQNSTSRTAPC